MKRLLSIVTFTLTTTQLFAQLDISERSRLFGVSLQQQPKVIQVLLDSGKDPVERNGVKQG